MRFNVHKGSLSGSMSLYPDQDRQKVALDLHLNCLTLIMFHEEFQQK